MHPPRAAAPIVLRMPLDSRSFTPGERRRRANPSSFSDAVLRARRPAPARERGLQRYVCERPPDSIPANQAKLEAPDAPDALGRLADEIGITLIDLVVRPCRIDHS